MCSKESQCLVTVSLFRPTFHMQIIFNENKITENNSKPKK
ncbi:hypothetical protein CR513_27109, partial [Mucuna pruriens]